MTRSTQVNTLTPQDDTEETLDLKHPSFCTSSQSGGFGDLGRAEQALHQHKGLHGNKPCQLKPDGERVLSKLSQNADFSVGIPASDNLPLLMQDVGNI